MEGGRGIGWEEGAVVWAGWRWTVVWVWWKGSLCVVGEGGPTSRQDGGGRGVGWIEGA